MQVVVPAVDLILETMIRAYIVEERGAFIVNIVLGLFQSHAQYVKKYAIPTTWSSIVTTVLTIFTDENTKHNMCPFVLVFSDDTGSINR